MENINNLIFPLEIYSHGLKTINSVKFSKREIDILACILSGKSAKGIAHFLSIAPKTAEAHTYNIMKKFNCTSRERVISLVEGSDKFLILKKYYISLLTHIEFEKSLKKIADLRSDEGKTYLIIQGPTQKNLSFLFQRIKSHLILAGIKAAIEMKEKIDPIASIIPDSKVDFCRIYILSDEDQEAAANKLSGVNNIYFSKSENYYFSFFETIKKVLPYSNLESIIAEFKQQYELTNESVQTNSPQENSNVQKEDFFPPIRKSFAKDRKWRLIAGFISVISVLGFGFFVFKGGTESHVLPSTAKPSGSAIRSDFILPNATTLLKRPELIAQIDNKFKGQDGIKTIAIVGMGGAGKTTAARYYAHQQRENVIWEINAETKESLSESFESLAYALAKNEEDKGILRELSEIKNSLEREKKWGQFVKDRLKLHSNWFLIYDNVEKFKDVQKYFPLDPETWGTGKIIITTRDSNIQNNNAVNQVIQIGELNKDQKLNLFMQIMNHGEHRRLPPTQTTEVTEFLEKIPPFPLDISVAAYYLKMANISYAKYLENLHQLDDSFTAVQESLLKEAGEYSKTRYSIITLSLKKLIDTHKDFADLLLFISLLDSQNIPKDLLNQYKKSTTVDNFIYNLKKYSLITNESSIPGVSSALSIHRSTQAITLAYLIQMLGLEKHSPSIDLIDNILKNYIRNALDTFDFPRIKSLISHYEVFLSHDILLSNIIKGTTNGDLSYLHYILSNYNKTEEYIKRSIFLLKKHSSSKNYYFLFRPLSYLGSFYWRKGEFKKSQEVFEECIEIYKKFKMNDTNGICNVLNFLGNVYIEHGYFEKAEKRLKEALLTNKKSHYANYSILTSTLSSLGCLYMRMGHYKKAKIYFEKSLATDKKYYPNNKLAVGISLANLGLIYSHLGYFEKAKNLHEKSLTISKQYYPEKSLPIAWELRNLGAEYDNLGNFKKAKNILEQSLSIFTNTLGENNIKTKWVLFLLGKVYKNIGNLDKAKTIFEDCLDVYIENHGRDTISTAGVLTELGAVYLLEKNLETAEEFLRKALNIYKIRKHPKLYKVLELCAELYSEKSNFEKVKENIQEAKNFKTQAIDNLKQALEIVNTHFPSDSPHIVRIQSKLKQLEQE